MPDSQDLSSGNDSTNYQAGGDVTIYQGMQYAEVRQMFMDLFDQQYDRVLAHAEDTASKRAAEVTDAFLRRLQQQPPEIRENLRDPGIQRAIVLAQIEYASTGDPEEVELYASLLIERVAHPAKNLTAIAAQQALTTIPLLTRRHINTLTILFVVLKVSFIDTPNLTLYRANLAGYLLPFAEGFSNDQDVLRHLDATNCLAFDTTRKFDLRQLLGPRLSPFGDEAVGDPLTVTAGDNQVVLDILAKFEANEGFLLNCFLSNTGTAVAHANLSRTLPTGPLSIWVR